MRTSSHRIFSVFFFICFSSFVYATPKPSIHILTVDLGTIISGPLEHHSVEFSNTHDIDIKITKVPFGELYSEITKASLQQSDKYDLYVYASQWMVDFAENNYIVDLTNEVLNDEALRWFDVSRFFRDFSSKYNSRIFSVPLDGDTHLLYYRSDILEKYKLSPPRTWDEYLRVAETLHGKDLNGDGIADYGSCISKKVNEQSYWSFLSIAGSYLQSKGTLQGMFFVADTMKPLVNNPAFETALRIFKSTSLFGPANELDMDTNDVRYAFIEGRCALTIEWGDIGTMSALPTSKVKGKTGVSMLPGTEMVLDRKTNSLRPCNQVLCPYSIEGINFAPYAAFGGWVGSVNRFATNKNKKLAYQFLSFVSQPERANIDVTKGATGFNPYRTSQLSEPSLWESSGMDRKTVRYYLGSITRTVNNANIILDLRVFENHRYLQSVLDVELNKFLTNKQSISKTMENIETEWNKITMEVGLKKQRRAYLYSLGRAEIGQNDG